MTTHCWACQATHASDAAFCSACGAEVGTATFDPTPGALSADVSTNSTIDTRPRANRLIVVAALALVGLLVWFVVATGDDETASDDAAPSSTLAPDPSDAAFGAGSGDTEAPATPSTGAAGLLGRGETPEAFDPFPDGAGITLAAHTEEAIVIVDLGSGQVTEFPLGDVVGGFNGTPTVVAVGRDVVATRGTTVVHLSPSTGEVFELGEASVVATADPGLNGGAPAVWLGRPQNGTEEAFGAQTTWTLVGLDGTPLRTVRLNQLLQLPKLGPEIIWEPGGGMYVLADDEDYRLISPGFPYSFSDVGVLIETCDEDRACQARWFDRRGEPLDLPVPDRQFSFPASASDDGRFYYSTDGLGRVYDASTGAGRAIFCGQHSWSPGGSLFACMNPTSLDVLDLAGTETMRYQFGVPLVGVALFPGEN